MAPLLEKADKDSNVEVYFGDAVHIIYGAELGSSWCIERQNVKSAYGRKRFNVMGAVNSVTNETIIVSNDSYITSQEIVALLKKAREKNADKEVYLFLDNAKYQKCELVRKASEEYNICIVYLPTYSPNLNLIERLWKFLRKQCLRNKYHLNFEAFSASILDCLSKTHTLFCDKMNNLLAHNFEALGI